MDMFPAVDPIPLPAPVWLFKLLHSVTMVLHFTAVHFLVGGLVCASLWSLWARYRGGDTARGASGEVSYRLPVVMAYVINLGVPPLLFTQVLYGRALYTSSVLIGVQWISIIFLLMFSYYLLYQMSARAERGAAFGWLGLIATLVVFKIGMIYSNNMTLMLRPEAWQKMYASDPLGSTLAIGDPTTFPRWTFMMVGSLAIGGIGLMIISLRPQANPAVRNFLFRWGAGLTATFILVQAACAWWVMGTQPLVVREGLMSHPVYLGTACAWLATAALLVVSGALGVVLKNARVPLTPRPALPDS